MSIFRIVLVMFFVASPAYATDITYATKSTGDTWTAANANEVKTAVNSKADLASPTLVTPTLGTIAAGVGTALTALNGENIQDNTIDDDSIDWGDVTLADFTEQTAWRVFYSNTDGDVTELALGADGTYLMSNGAAVAPTFETPSGTGDLLADGTIPMTAHWSFGAYNILGGVNSTWSGVGTFGTLSSGAGGFTVDADGDTVAQTVTVDTEAYGAGWDGDLTVPTKDEVYDEMELKLDAAGASFVMGDLTDLRIEDTAEPDTGTDLVDDTIAYEDADDDLHLWSISKIGGYLFHTPVTDSTTDFAANFTGANLYGGTFVADNDNGDLQLPAVAAGMNFTIITLGAIEVVVEPNASDLMILDGTALDDADSATNTSTAGDIIVFQYYDATGWLATSNGWTDED